jgi:hypothetical protein
MSEKTYPNMLTSEAFHGLHARYGFTQAQDGAAAVLNEELVNLTIKLTKQAMLQAEHEGHSGLNGNHARKAIEATPEVPKGVY